ncbi:uncharacterized protein, partial [Diadema antillarum]|uniref:uncharacterized protein n=1 Tax=Diadema antillarum TaxID=105358 RepID=UPI003A845283
MMSSSISINQQLLLVSLLAAIVGSCSLNHAANSSSGWRLCLSGFAGLMSFFLAIMSLWMSTYRISYGHNLKTAYIHFTLVVIFAIIRFRKLSSLQKAWKTPRQAQEDLLKSFLQANAKTEYGKDYNLSAISSLEDLREKHTLTEYERYQAYIERMAKGETGVLTGEPPVRFSLTSGTTGKSKMLPYPKSFFSRVYTNFIAVVGHTTTQNFGNSYYLQHEVYLYTAPKMRYTEGGTLMAPASMIPAYMRPLLVIHSTPSDGFDIFDPYDAIYVHLLFGLRDRNIGSFNASFTSNLMSAMRQLEKCWPDIVLDIENGTVSAKKLPPKTHRALEQAMGNGNPERAAELRSEFEKGFEGIMARVWPYLLRVQAIDSVGLKDELLRSYVKGLPLYGGALGATEGVMAMNITPTKKGKDEFVLMPTFTVFEFIPEEN